MQGNPDYVFFEELLRREAGLIVTPDKAHLLEMRLLPVAFKNGLEGISGVALRLRQAEDPRLLQEVVEAMAVGDTFFFRDQASFSYFEQEALPALSKAKKDGSQLRFWSAACATGQEAYSLAMLLHEQRQQGEILATDISQEKIDFAKAALYPQFEVQRGLSARRLVKYFTKQDQDWRLTRAVADRVSFARGNLLVSEDYPQNCDVIFCRNILSQFAPETRQAALASLKAALTPGGFLFLGADEALSLPPGFHPAGGVAGVFRFALL